MKIAYFSHSILPSNSANTVHIMKMCESFAKNKCEVVLYSLTSSNLEANIFDTYGVQKIFKINHYKLFLFPGFLYLYCTRVLLNIVANNYDIVYSRSLIGCFFLSFTNISFAFENHNPRATLKGLRKRMYDRVVKSRNIKQVIVISEALKKIVLAETHIVKPIAVFHDSASIPKISDKNFSIRNERNKIKIGYIGSIGKGRGVELILICAQKLSDIDFHIVGGTMQDAENKLGIKACNNNVYFHGYVPHAKTADYLFCFDILLAPYQYSLSLNSGKNSSEYMSPLKIFEYMSSGKPIIASDLSVIREVLNDNNAILCKPDNIDEWVNGIKTLCENKNLSETISKQAFKDYLDKYTWDNRAKEILGLINNNK